MSYSSDMDGLDLFTAPFRNSQASKADAASQLRQPKATVPQAPEKARPSAWEQPEPSKKELTLDMSDSAIPAGKPPGASEEARRKAHEEAEAKRKEEWDAKQLAKKRAEEAAVLKLQNMSDADAVKASTDRVRTDVERITRRNMKECVSDHIQNLCRKDPAFARKTLHPRKSMVRCFRYINRKAKDYIRQEMEDNDIKPDDGVYGGDVPDGLCYQWAEDYFNDPDAREDKEKEENFIPRPYVGTASKTGKTPKKKTAKKETKNREPVNGYQQMSLPGVQ